MFFILFIWSAWGLSSQSKKVYDQLDTYWTKAKEATTKVELTAIHQDLQKFARSKCLLRAYGQYAMKVDQYIRGKYDGMIVDR